MKRISFRNLWSRIGCMAVAALASVTLYSCSNDDPEPEPGGVDNPGSENVDPSAEVNGVMTEANMTGFVIDTDGKALEGVTVRTGTHSAVTNAAGAFSFSKIDVNEGRSIVNFSKDGYFSVTRAAKFADNEVWNIVMVKKNNARFTACSKFESTQAAKLKAEGMEVALAANGMKNCRTGLAYSGKVVADMVYLDPNNEHFAEMMPGSDLSAVRADGSNVTLISYGMTAVNLTDEDGNELQLAEGTPATLTFPIPEGMENDLHETIPLWSFNEATGKWVEEGVARLENGVYVGTVTHFSWVNLDWPEEQAVVECNVKDTEGNPLAMQRVRVGQITVSTDKTGHFKTEVPAGTSFKVYVPSEWYGDYTPEVSVAVSSLSPREVRNVELVLPALYHVTGRLLENGKPAIGYLWLTCSGNDGQKTVTNGDGTFSLTIPVNYTGSAVLNILAGQQIAKDITVEKKDLDLGDIEIGSGELPGNPEDNKIYTATESKLYLENVATDFLKLFRPEDQADIVKLARYFVDTYGELEAPEEWGLDEYDEPLPHNVMKNVLRAFVRRDPAALSRVAEDEYDFARFSGVYEPGSASWRKTADSKDIVFKFNNAAGQACSLTASQDGDQWSVSSDGTTVRVPENVTLKLTEGSKTHLHATIRSKVNRKGHTASMSVNVVAANIEVTAAINGTDSRITQNCVIKVSGKEAITTTAAIDGRDLCNSDKWESVIENEDDDALNAMFSKATAEVNVLSRLQVKGEASDFRSIAEALDAYYDSWDYDTQAEAKAQCDADCKLLNSRLITQVFYSSSKVQATLWFQPDFYEDEYYGDWWEIYVVPALRFNADGTVYTFEDYFGNSRFVSVENQWDVLINSYKNLWK